MCDFAKMSATIGSQIWPKQSNLRCGVPWKLFHAGVQLNKARCTQRATRQLKITEGNEMNVLQVTTIVDEYLSIKKTNLRIFWGFQNWSLENRNCNIMTWLYPAHTVCRAVPDSRASHTVCREVPGSRASLQTKYHLNICRGIYTCLYAIGNTRKTAKSKDFNISHQPTQTICNKGQ